MKPFGSSDRGTVNVSLSPRGTLTRPLFRRLHKFGCHPKRKDEPRLPCREHRRTKMLVSILVRSYSSAAPRAELLNHLVNPPGTEEPPPEALPLPGLGIVYVSRIGVQDRTPSQLVTSLGGVIRRSSSYAPALRPVIVSASRGSDFSG